MNLIKFIQFIILLHERSLCNDFIISYKALYSKHNNIWIGYCWMRGFLSCDTCFHLNTMKVR
jgi:hypothetical protein